MISVLICSINPELLQNVTDNISKTIGVPFEIIYFDNRMTKSGICEVYNELAAKSKYDILCFLHEDVLIKTEIWGEIILNLFTSDTEIGMIGIAGSKYKSAYFSGWYSGVKKLDCANYMHKDSTGIERVLLSPTDQNNTEEEVVCLDGVMICCKKEAWQKTLFDDKLLTGFHFYDIDFSIRIAHKYKVIIVYNIDLVHITTGGDYSDNWIETAILYHNNKKVELPFSKLNLNNKKVDKQIIITTMDHLKNYKITFRNKIRWIVFQKLYSDPLFYYSILKFMLYQPLGLKKIHDNFKSK